MKSALVLITLVALTTITSASIAQSSIDFEADIRKLTNGIGGGNGCAICTIAVHLIEQYSTIHSMSIDTFVKDHLCSLFSDEKIRQTCDEIENTWGPKLIEILAENVDPDDACRKLNFCSAPQCNLVPTGQHSGVTLSRGWEDYVASASSSDSTDPAKWFNKIVGWFKNLTGKAFNEHLPITDIDGDRFSASLAQLRGTHWRGKDCDALDDEVYPGRKDDTLKTLGEDYNCNGIKGVNPSTGKPYKEELCGNSVQQGVAVFGDSVGAHFQLPPKWFNASEWSQSAFSGALGELLDELDLPYKSMMTGFVPTSTAIPVESVYKYLLQRNQCNHRDYQNLAVNGAKSENFENITKLARNPKTDHPMLVMLELVGNDVCSSHHTFSTMTTPSVFYDNIVKILKYLDTVLPAGSHVMTIGLADGRVLYDTLHNRLHPIGYTYTDIYDYLNCLNISPCWGWMNSDESVRNHTYEIATSLSAQYPKIIANEKFENFDIQYYPFPIEKVMAKWVAEGHDPAKLIEPVDGFHPSQTANALMAEWYWNALQQDHPEWLGGVNPNNETITKLFGDQGGY